MPTWVRALGLAAVGGGALTVVDSFTTHSLPAAMLAPLYLAARALLLLGMDGIFWSRRATLGIAGVIGAATCVVGILFVRVSAIGMLGANGYQLAATIALIGLVILSSETVLRRSGATASAVLWLGAFVLGVIGVFCLTTPVLTGLAARASRLGFLA